MNQTDRFPSVSAQDDEQLAQWLIGILDEELDGLDANTRWCLRRARHRALVAPSERPWFIRMQRYRHVAAGFASSVVVMLMIATLSPSAVTPLDEDSDRVALGDLHVLASGEELEFLGSIDFLIWLEQQRV